MPNMNGKATCSLPSINQFAYDKKNDVMNTIICFAFMLFGRAAQKIAFKVYTTNSA